MMRKFTYRPASKEERQRKIVIPDKRTLSRLGGISGELMKRGMSMRRFSCESGLPLTTLRRMVTGFGLPNIGTYIRAGEFLGWDMKDDINLVYLSKKIRGVDMVLRIAELGYTASELENVLQIHGGIWRHIYYSWSGSAQGWHKVLSFVERREKEYLSSYLAQYRRSTDPAAEARKYRFRKYYTLEG